MVNRQSYLFQKIQSNIKDSFILLNKDIITINTELSIFIDMQ